MAEPRTETSPDTGQDEASEIDVLDPELLRRTLSTGLEVEVIRLRTRQFFRLLRILTHGAGVGLIQLVLNVSPETNSQEFGVRMLSLILMAIPDAEQPAIDFLQSMVRPVGIIDKPDKDLTKQQREANIALWQKLADATGNPETDDTITIVEAVVLQESDNLLALGKRVMAMLRVADKTGQLGGGTTAQPPTEMEQALANGQRQESGVLVDPALL